MGEEPYIVSKSTKKSDKAVKAWMLDQAGYRWNDTNGAQELSDGLYSLSLPFMGSQVITADKACHWRLWVSDSLPLYRVPENYVLTVAPDGKSATIEAMTGAWRDGEVALIVTPVDSPPSLGGSPDGALVEVTTEFPDLVGKPKLNGAQKLSEGRYFLPLQYKRPQVITADKACHWALWVRDSFPLYRVPENYVFTVAPDGKSATIEAMTGAWRDGELILIVTPIDSFPYKGGSPDDAHVIIKATNAWWQWLILILCRLFGFLWH